MHWLVVVGVRIGGVPVEESTASDSDRGRSPPSDSFPTASLPGEAHRDVYVEGMHISRTDADGVNIHGAVVPLVFTDSFIRNAGNDCFAVWPNVES